MKTFAVTLCALLATGSIALAHGTAAGGGPVMSPVSMPVIPMSAGGTTVQSSPTQFGSPVFSPNRPAPIPIGDNHRRHKKAATYLTYGPLGLWDPKICRPPQWLFGPDGAIQLNAAYPCGLDDSFVAQNYGPIPYWLPPAFMW